MALNKAQLMETPGGPGVVGAVQPGTGITITGGVISVDPVTTVTKLVAGENITLDPANGLGIVTITSTGGGGGGEANPTPGNTIVSPAFDQGDGTAGNPFVITPATVNVGGASQSSQLITFSGLTAGQQVIFRDLNSSVNSNRFAQPTGVVSGNGTYTFRLQFVDNPATQGGATYTAQIQVGTATVYFRWNVTVLSSGILTPTILKVQDLQGSFLDAPTSPAFLTSTLVGALGPVGTVSGLTPSDSTPLLTPTTTTGSGLQVQVNTTASGGLGLIEVVSAGTGYTFGQEVNLDLSSVGGGTAVPFYIFTRPATGNTVTFQVTAFQGVNAGTLSLSEWQFSTTPDFASPTTTTSTSTATTISVGTGIGPNQQYYGRFRYKSSTGVYSEYSPIIRAATGSLVELEYIFKSFAGAQYNGQSFDSEPFYVSPKPYLYFVAIDNTGGINALAKGGVDSEGSSRGRGLDARAGMYLQLRQPVKFAVNTVDAGGSVTSVTQVGTSYGLPDTYNVTTGAPFTGGSGTGCVIILKRNTSNGATELQAVQNPGTGYTVGDILTFDPPIGNGNPGTLDSYWDTLLHGVGSMGYFTKNGDTGYGNCATGLGGIATYTLYPTPGGNGRGGGDVFGGAGSAGWLGGQGGAGGTRCGDQFGGGGATWFSSNIVTNGTAVSTSYPEQGIDVFINGLLVQSVVSAVYSYRLA